MFACEHTVVSPVRARVARPIDSVFFAHEMRRVHTARIVTQMADVFFSVGVESGETAVGFGIGDSVKEHFRGVTERPTGQLVIAFRCNRTDAFGRLCFAFEPFELFGRHNDVARRLSTVVSAVAVRRVQELARVSELLRGDI